MSEIIVDEYNVFGNYYDRFNTKNPIARIIMHSYIKAIKTLAAPLQVNNILEIGCGEGGFTQTLHELKPDKTYEAIDVDKNGIEENKKIFPGVVFKVMSVYDMTYPDCSQDFIVVIDVLEHLKDFHKALTEIKRVSSKYLLFACPREPIFRILNIARLTYLKDWGNTPGHVNHWSTKKFVELIRSYFKIVRVLKPLPFTVILCRNETSNK